MSDFSDNFPSFCRGKRKDIRMWDTSGMLNREIAVTVAQRGRRAFYELKVIHHSSLKRVSQNFLIEIRGINIPCRCRCTSDAWIAPTQRQFSCEKKKFILSRNFSNSILWRDLWEGTIFLARFYRKFRSLSSRFRARKTGNPEHEVSVVRLSGCKHFSSRISRDISSRKLFKAVFRYSFYLLFIYANRRGKPREKLINSNCTAKNCF